MEYLRKVNIFLLILAVGAIIIAIFALNRESSPTFITKYEEDIRVLRDSITTLKGEIARYTSEIDRINLEREKIKEKLDLIAKENEETDTELANGDWDTNIKFLTDFLSEEDNFRE